MRYLGSKQRTMQIESKKERIYQNKNLLGKTNIQRGPQQKQNKDSATFTLPLLRTLKHKGINLLGGALKSQFLL